MKESHHAYAILHTRTDGGTFFERFEQGPEEHAVKIFWTREMPQRILDQLQDHAAKVVKVLVTVEKVPDGMVQR